MEEIDEADRAKDDSRTASTNAGAGEGGGAKLSYNQLQEKA